MELIVFDLDGTLLDRRSQISDFTSETLKLLHQRGIAYTVATGRTLHAARDAIRGHAFIQPQVYKNGVTIWDPRDSALRHQHTLSPAEIAEVLSAFASLDVVPFVFTLEPNDVHAVYHPATNDLPARLLESELKRHTGLHLRPLSQLPADAAVINISALGQEYAVRTLAAKLEHTAHLVAYLGHGIGTADIFWLDIHHSASSKGAAIEQLREDLQFSRVICFGDSENDLSMFTTADEAYAPANASDQVKSAATAVIGHHDEDGIARFLRERFL
jgi:Cof subfamily protein (haloacid dehalogenase superfamily)